MSEEQVVQPLTGEQIPVATPEPTAGLETASEQVSNDVSEEQTPEVEKTFTQKELDEILAKRLAKAERKAQREADRRIAQAIQEAQPKQQIQAEGRPKPESFTSTEDYIEAVADWKAGEKIRNEFEAREKAQLEERAKEEVSRIQGTYHTLEDDARDRYDDFDKVAYQTPYDCTPAMAQTIELSDKGPDLAYYLGKHPEEAERIAQLPPLRAAQELGKLELKISESPKIKHSSAPDPIRPLAAKGDQPVRDTTDPKSDKLSTQEWIRLENERERKKLASKGYR